LNNTIVSLVGGPPQFPPAPEPTVSALHNGLLSLLVSVDSSDTAPTTQATATFESYRGLLNEQLQKWVGLKEKELASLNVQLRQHNLEAIGEK